MKWIGWLPLATLLVACGSTGSRNALNESALYDPAVVTLKDGVVYHMQEGTLVGRGQHFYSSFTYQRAIIIGNDNK